MCAWGLLLLVAICRVSAFRQPQARHARAAVQGASATRARAAVRARPGSEADAEEEPPDAPRQELDWRVYRARLVAQEAKAQEAKSQQQPAPADDAAADDTGALPLVDELADDWVIETNLIETGSVILASTQQRHGFALAQQYFHKCVMLIIHHSEDMTRGIILNRPAPFKDENGWSFWFGGDVASLSDERGEREVTCLHTLDSVAAERLSIRVISGISYTSLRCAMELVALGEARREDFWCFVGYAGWGAGQLQNEMRRDSGSTWRLVSADGGVLLRELMRQQREGQGAEGGQGDGLGDGLGTWERLMRQIGQGSLEVDSSAGSFADRMLRAWIRANLRPLPAASAPGLAAIAAAAASEAAASAVVLESGAVLRAAPCCASFTLRRQFLHKALVLLLRAGRSGSIGVVLNLPTPAKVVPVGAGGIGGGGGSSQGSVSGGQGSGGRLLLFGGTLALRDSSVVWLHRKAQLEGEPLGSSGLFRIPGADALAAVERDLAVEADFVGVLGALAWRPGELEREVAAGHFSPVVDPESVPWDQIWQLADPSSTHAAGVGGQLPGRDVWEAVTQAEPSSIIGGLLDVDATESEIELADLALVKWVDMFLS